MSHRFEREKSHSKACLAVQFQFFVCDEYFACVPVRARTTALLLLRTTNNLGHIILELYNVLVQIRLTQLKQNVTSSTANLVYELPPPELLNNLRLRKKQ